MTDAEVLRVRGDAWRELLTTTSARDVAPNIPNDACWMLADLAEARDALYAEMALDVSHAQYGSGQIMVVLPGRVVQIRFSGLDTWGSVQDIYASIAAMSGVKRMRISRVPDPETPDAAAPGFIKLVFTDGSDISLPLAGSRIDRLELLSAIQTGAGWQ